MGFFTETEPLRWRISLKTLRRQYNCTIEGITESCGGKCCKSEAFWPPNARPQADGGCHYLSDQGCTLDPKDKPVVCLLYPFLLHGTNLVFHFRAPNGHCKKCYGVGPPAYESLRGSLVALFGEDEYARLLEAAKGNEDYHYINVPLSVRDSLAQEKVWEAAGEVPLPRAGGKVRLRLRVIA